MKYKVGDKVRVKNNLQDDVFYGKVPYAKTMEKYKGEVLTIDSISKEYYFVKEDYGKFKWTDEMFEPVEEMSAEEAIRTFGEVCKDTDCWHCPIKEIDKEHSCTDIKINRPEEIVKILKQWKADREKKPIETEFIWYLLVVEEKTHIVKCEKPLKFERERTTDEQKEELLREWCSEHDGKYYVTTERRCVVKE